MKSVQVIALILFALGVSNARANDWTTELELYGMASNIKGEAGIGRVTDAEVDVDFDTILENLEIAAMLHLESFHTSGFGIVLDYGFMDLRADISGVRGGIVDARVRQGVFEALLARRMSHRGGQVDFFAGLRWWDNDIEVAVDPAIRPGPIEADVKEDWVDVVLGARWDVPLSESWKFQARADVGGLGVSADFTSSISMGVRYKLSKFLDLDLQYKGTWVDYKTGSRGQPGYYKYDTLTHGPIVGLVMKF